MKEGRTHVGQCEMPEFRFLMSCNSDSSRCTQCARIVFPRKRSNWS